MARASALLLRSVVMLPLTGMLPTLVLALEPPATRPTTIPSTQPTTRPAPKALSDQTKKGLAWLASMQRPDGGWDQGEINTQGIRSGESDKSNVADTAMVTLAFLRSGEDLKDGRYTPNIRKAIDFICGHVEKSSQEGISITDIRVTRLQSKLGPNIDTFSAALLLAELRQTMAADDVDRKRVVAALDKVMDKIEKNQNKDGGFVNANEGWAAALCNSVANKAVNKAAIAGASVSEATIEKAQDFAAKNISIAGGTVSTDGSAGVELYARSANLQNLQDQELVNQGRVKAVEDKLAVAKESVDKAEKALAQAQAEPAATPATTQPLQAQLREAQAEFGVQSARMEAIRGNSKNLQAAQAMVVNRFNDEKFVAGFGNNGGEEFLSYMNVGESLLIKGGEEFTKWDKAMTDNLQRIQNTDGSWSGQHCITGRTFCTAAALLTLTVDRSHPSMVALKQ